MQTLFDCVERDQEPLNNVLLLTFNIGQESAGYFILHDQKLSYVQTTSH